MLLLKCFRPLLKIGQLEVKGQSVIINFFSTDVSLIKHLSLSVVSVGSRNHFSLSVCCFVVVSYPVTTDMSPQFFYTL